METFELSELWKRTLGPQEDDPHAAMRDTLRSAFLQFRRTVKPLAGEIAVSMPMFTDHSIEHLDALWDTASLILGPDYPINPAEAFVLGGAFLLHDLGMGLAAFPDGHQSILEDPLFADAKAALVSSRGMQPKDAHDAAIVQVLRLRHARQSERLVGQQFSSNGTSFYLLQDTELRAFYGPMIGRIAHSHWFNVSELSSHFDVVIGAHASLPPEWQVDPFKIACVLRLADAAQIDSRRAPLYLHAFRKPTGVSEDHWLFQQRLPRPRRNDDRLEYTSSVPFSSEESSSWWLAYDTVKMINDELRLVDAACADMGKDRFPVKSVAGADNPARFSRYVRTDGWSPIDASLRVNNVTKIVENLGGTALYGNKPLLGLRELISNAADATRARKVQFGGTDLAVQVHLYRESDQWILTVRDRGLGMTGPQLVANLTDFGTSNWVSSSRLEEYPGLLSKGYKPTGRFGIGFYASFMLADRVEVRSLRYRGASSETAVLVFQDGAKVRPLLRPAVESEQLDLGGTEVRLFLKEEPDSFDGLLNATSPHRDAGQVLAALAKPMCALMDIDLQMRGPKDDSFTTIVRGDEWKTMPPSELFDLLYLDELDLKSRSGKEVYREAFIANVEDILDTDGDIIGRASFAVRSSTRSDTTNSRVPASVSASVYVGGMTANSIHDVLGAFVGEPLKADRNSAFPIAKPGHLKEWAESQGRRIMKGYGAKATPPSANEIVLGFGGEVSGLVCGYTHEGPIRVNELATWISDKTDVFMIDDSDLQRFERADGDVTFFDSDNGNFVRLPDNAIVLDTYTSWLLPDEVLAEPYNVSFEDLIDTGKPGIWDPALWWCVTGTQNCAYQVLRAASEAWKCDEVELGMCLERWFHRSDRGSWHIPCIDSDESTEVNALRLPKMK